MILAFAIMGCLYIGYYKFAGNKTERSMFKPSITTVTDTQLMEVLTEYHLWVAEFTYNGIAEGELAKPKGKKCHIKYYAIVKAGVDLGKVKCEVDNEKRLVKVKLPDIELEPRIDDTKQLSFIPENTNID